MSITDELRDWVSNHYSGWPSKQAEGFAIADRIDAEHEEALREAYAKGCEDGIGVANKADMRAEYLRGKNDGYDEGFASADDWLAQHEDAMAEHGWVRLPVDADGEVVRIGDVMVMASHPFGCEDKPLVVDRMELSRGMHGEVWCLALDTDRSCWTQAAVLRHYHAPTVEDVLREFADEVQRCCDTADTIAEYAAKLRLAGDGK